MIFVLVKSGQMCNQLLTLASAYALGLEYGDSVKCPVIDSKLKYAFCFQNAANIKVKMYESPFWKILAKIISITKKIFKVSDNKKYDKNKIGKLQIFTDWISFNDAVILAKHQDEIRQYFAFKPFIEEKCREIIDDVRTEGKKLVGVHIRRGDYKSFNNGIWYYSDDEYIHWMKCLLQEKNVRYVLFSNEPLEINKFIDAGLDVVYLAGNAVEDLCCLSKCDYIMGPPSTYSWWASMYGNSPRLILESKEDMYSWDDFLLLDDMAIAGNDK